MDDCNFYTGENYPNNVHYNIKTASCPMSRYNLFSKWKQGQECHFESLNGEWYANDSDHQNEASEEIKKKNKKSSKYNPDNITNEIHVTILTITF